MRKDMKDVIVNTGRHGGSGKNKWGRHRLRMMDPEETPNRIPISRRRQYGYDSKELGDRIAPLRAYLDKQVGRPWADVWHDICEHADARTIRGFHLRSHVWFEVHRDRYRGSYGSQLFIDDDGTLQKSKEREWAHAERKPVDTITTDDPDLFYQKIDGYWYSFETFHTASPCSREDLVMVDGEVQIVKIPMPDAHHHEVVKKQVGSEIAKILEEQAARRDTRWRKAA